MASWKKVIVSGSEAELSKILGLDGTIDFSGTLDGSTPSILTISGSGADKQVTFVSPDSITNAAGVFSNFLVSGSTGDFLVDGGDLITFDGAGANAAISVAASSADASNHNVDISVADASTGQAGVAKLYTSFGANTDGGIDQATLNAFSASIASDISGLDSTLEVSGSTGDIAIDLTSDVLTIDGVGAISTDASGTSVSISVASADASTDGVAKLYTSFGTNTDGSIDQATLNAFSASISTDIDGVTLTFVDTAGQAGVDFTDTSGTITATVNGLGTADSPLFASLETTTDLTVGTNLTVEGDMTVNGTTTLINTTNLAIEDQFILLASGSTTAIDGGIVVQNDVSGIGYGLGYDSSANKWVLQTGIDGEATTIVSDAALATVQTAAVAPAANPIYGGATGLGTIYVDSATEEIYIFS